MKYNNKEVMSDTEAKRFAHNLCKKREQFPRFDDALAFVFRIRCVVSDAEFGRMQREHRRELARIYSRDEKRPRIAPTVREVERAVGVRS